MELEEICGSMKVVAICCGTWYLWEDSGTWWEVYETCGKVVGLGRWYETCGKVVGLGGWYMRLVGR